MKELTARNAKCAKIKGSICFQECPVNIVFIGEKVARGEPVYPVPVEGNREPKALSSFDFIRDPNK